MEREINHPGENELKIAEQSLNRVKKTFLERMDIFWQQKKKILLEYRKSLEEKKIELIKKDLNNLQK
jgi:hypothetical protein